MVWRWVSNTVFASCALAAMSVVAVAQTPGSYRVGQSVNARDLIVCNDDMNAEDIADAFKIGDAEAAKEYALAERIKEGGESICRRLSGEQVRILGMPVTTVTRPSDQQKATIVKVETAAGRAYYAVLFGDYRIDAAPELAPPPPPPPPPAAAAPPPPPPPKVSLADTLPGRYSVSGTNPNGSSYSGQVTIRHDRGTYYFVWRVGGDTFRGSGKLRGRTLTINWGQSSPVIYQVQGNGVLIGRWANGAGTEDLEKMD